jgi:DNA polymerase III subunit epsilon
VHEKEGDLLMEFVVIDFETANSSHDSVCQIGIAEFQNGEMVKTWETLVDPEEDFGENQIGYHKIQPADINGQPTFTEIYPKLVAFLSNKIVVSHTTFDLGVLTKSIKKANLDPIQCEWLNSAEVVRKTWPQFSKTGYTLDNMANFLNIELDHHKALSDSIAAGKILLEANRMTEKTARDWVNLLGQPKTPKSTAANQSAKPSGKKKAPAFPSNKTIPGNPNGPHFGKRMLVSGLGKSREETKKKGVDAGFDFERSFNVGAIHFLVIADKAFEAQNNGIKTGKLKDAEKNIKKGYDITIISESEFLKMLSSENS